MDTTDMMISIIAGVLGVAGLIAVIYAQFRTNLTAETLKLYEQNKTALEDRVSTLEGDHVRNRASIADMESRIKVLQTIPLETLAQHMSDIQAAQNQILTTQNAILAKLTLPN